MWQKQAKFCYFVEYCFTDQFDAERHDRPKMSGTNLVHHLSLEKNKLFYTDKKRR